MQKYSYIMGEDFVCLVNTTNGNSVTMYSSNKNYSKFVDLINAGKYEQAEILGDVKVAINRYLKVMSQTGMQFRVSDTAVQWLDANYDHEDGWVDLHNAITSRIIDMAKAGLNVTPLANFIENLMNNPSKQAVDELYLFLEATKLPITDDGYFIAYKLVRDDYMDIYTGKFDNSVGQRLWMSRNEVDDRRNNTCSTGFHFCSKEYLPHYGSATNSRCVLVKINPADVVSIPSDYNNAKGRCNAYEVVGEYKDWASMKEYTDSVVVSGDNPWDEYNPHEFFDGNVIGNLNDEIGDSEYYDLLADICAKYWFDLSMGGEWKLKSSGERIRRQHLSEAFDVPLSDIYKVEEMLSC